MKKITFLILALVALCSVSANATNEANIIRHGDLNAMTEGQTKQILIAAISTTSPGGAAGAGKGYFLGSTGTTFSYHVSYTDDNGATNNVATAANTDACLWTITKTATGFTIKDQGGNYLKYSGGLGVGNSADVWTVANSGTMTVSFQDSRTDIAKDKNDIVRFVTSSSTFLNQNGPQLAAGTGGWSYWLVLEVSEADPLLDDAKAAIAAGEEIYAGTQPTIVQANDTKLITAGSQLSSNKPDESEGLHIEYLIDDDPSTFFHSSWHSVGSEPHNLQVSLPGNTHTIFYLKYTDRTANDDHIKTMNVYGSNDGGETYSEKLATVELPTHASGATGEIGFDLGATPYTYYKFDVVDCAPSYRTYFHSAEFQLYEGASEIEYVVDASLVTALRSAIDALQAKITNKETILQADIDAVNNAKAAIVAAANVTYTVNITGAPAGTHVTIDGHDYEDGDEFNHSPILVGDVEPQVVAGYALVSCTIAGTNINVKYRHDYPVDPATFTSKYITAIGPELTSGLVANPGQWYLLKQDRKGGSEYNFPSPVWDNGNGADIKRAATDDVVALNSVATNVTQYLVRFVQGEFANENSYYIQFGTGRYFGTDLKASADAPGNFRVYTATSGRSYGHWAINKTTNGTNDLDKVDNNGISNNISYWGTGTTTEGTNNVWALYPVTLGDEMVIDLTALNAAITKAQAIADLLGAGYGKYSENTPGTLASVIAAGEALAADPTTQSAVDAATSNLNAAIAGATINVPANGSFFRIKGETSGKYIAAGLASNNKFKMTNDTDNSTLFYMLNNKLMVVSDGKWNAMNSGQWTWADDAASASTVEFTQGNLVGYYLVHSNNAYFYDNGNGSPASTDRGGSYDSRDQYHKWTLEAVDPADVALTITAAGCATFVSEFPLDFAGTGVTAYVCTGLTEHTNHLVMQAVEKVPARTAVYVLGTTDDIPVYTGNAFTEYSGTNCLVGNLTGSLLDVDQTDGDYTNFILQKKEANPAKFYMVHHEGNTVANGRAYLKLLTTSLEGKSILDIDLDDDPTAISHVENVGNVENAENIYDLTGRKVDASYKGVVIINGKKYMVK